MRPGPYGRARTQECDPQTVIGALEDDTCQAILEATATQPHTASELMERCEIPSSTLYRKLDTLTDAGLLEERIRIRRDGRHASEYQQCFDDVTISIADGGSVTVDVSPRAQSPATSG